MDAMQPIPTYREQVHRKHDQKDVVAKEMHQLDKQLKKANRKNRKLNERYTNQKARRKQAERQLEEERTASIRREKQIILKTKLDDLAFFRGDTQEEALQ